MKNPVDMRSLTPDARCERRTEVIQLRETGLTYVQIGARTGLSRTGVFDICKRYAATGRAALRDACASSPSGAVRKLRPSQEAMLRRLISDFTPDQLDLPDPLWTRSAAARLIDRRVGLRLKERTLGTYLARWGFSPLKAAGSVRDASPAECAWLRWEYPGVAARAAVEDAEVNWGDDTPLSGVAGAARGAGQRAADEDDQLGLTSAVNSKGQMRWKVRAGALTAIGLVEFLRRLVESCPKKVFLLLRDSAVQAAPAVQAWLGEHVDEIEVFRRPAQGLRRTDELLDPVSARRVG